MLTWEYVNRLNIISMQDKILCDIDKRKLTLGGDEYHIEIDDTQNHRAFLLTTIALDRIYYTKK
ncbi:MULTISPECIES: hypothetical protein [Enterococcus]|uniref:hypothetical protein n=1 Tax=Enterococcus TaxID=1350 RepID=UPI001A90D6F0|nr:hypothetical protein [Enterococcus ureilyticus]MBO0445475.1 hypothetical protein [Enterococcus ureilyticus]